VLAEESPLAEALPRKVVAEAEIANYVVFILVVADLRVRQAGGVTLMRHLFESLHSSFIILQLSKTSRAGTS